MKVFCKNCKWECHGLIDDEFGGPSWYCYHPQFITKKICGNYIWGLRKEKYSGSPKENNPNGECAYYKCKWWKFWVDK